MIGIALFADAGTYAGLDERRTLENVVYSQTEEPLVIIGNAVLAQKSSGGVGTRNDPYLIQARTITSDRTCVQIENTTAFFVLTGGEYSIDDGSNGFLSVIPQPVILLNRVRHGAIRNTYISGGEIGIEVVDSQDCNVENCTIRNTVEGVSLDTTDNCTVRDSSIFHNQIGIKSFVTSNLKVYNNVVYSNTYAGIEIGFFSENNTVYQNRIGWNEEWNAVDNGNNNAFTDGSSIGNSWSDYVGTGVYEIYGIGGSIDIFASRLRDDVKPVIDSLDDVIIDVESTEEYLSWKCIEEYPNRYTIHINGELEIQGLWGGEEIDFQIAHLAVGSYDVILTVFDAAGNSHQDSVMVSVISFMLGGIGTELVMLASGVTVAIFLLLIFIIKKIG